MAGEAAEPESEIAAIFARLQDEVRSRAPGPPERRISPARRAPLAARLQAERTWAVTADRPFEYLPGWWGRLRGYLLVPVKLVLRKLMRWYVEPLAVHQRSFNSAALRLVDELAERAAADVSRLEHRIEALEARLASDWSEPNR